MIPSANRATELAPRTGWSAEVGYEIYLRDGSKGDALWERIMSAGRPHGIRPTGPSDIRRVEGGILNWGADILLEDTPYHVGLERLVDLKKTTDYMGKEALARVREKGVDRKLVGKVKLDALLSAPGFDFTGRVIWSRSGAVVGVS